MGQVPHILLLNDPNGKVSELVRFLKGQHYKVSTLPASLDNAEVFEWIDKERVDVIIIDLARPDLSLHKFLKKLRILPSTACVILTGATIEPEKVDSFLRGGVFAYVKSPFSSDRLEKAIRQGLKNRQKLQKILDLSGLLESAYTALSQDRDRLQRWNDDLGRLHTLTQTLGESLHLEEVVKALMGNLKKIVAYDVACLFVKNEGHVRIAQGQGRGRIPLGEGREKALKVQMLKEAQSFLTPREFPIGIYAQRGGAEITVPLRVAAEQIGLLKLVRLTKTIFDDYHSKMLSMVATPLALALRNAEMYRHVQELAVKDDLTSVLNRRAFSKILDREFKRANRYTSDLSLILIDIDHFKEVNDTYGHLVGDCVLREMALLLKRSVRETDVLTRYGGEEFVVILPGSGIEAVLVAARRMREKINAADFGTESQPIGITVSMGVTHCPAPGIQTPEALFSLADQALYLAKKRGRNRIEVFSRVERKMAGAVPAR